MIRILILAIVIGGALFFILYHLFSFFFTVSNPKSRVMKDRKYGLIKIRELADGLVPFDSEELRILSMKRDAPQHRRTFHAEEYGQLSTIYNEPLVAYYLFDYLDGRKLLLTEMSQHDIELYHENNSTNVWVDGKLKYNIDHLGNLRHSTGTEIIAAITSDSTQSYRAIRIAGDIKAHVLTNAAADTDNPRAFPVIESDSDHDTKLCYILALYSMFISL